MKQSLLQMIYYEYAGSSRFNVETNEVKEEENNFSAVLEQVKDEALCVELLDAASYVGGAHEMQGFMKGVKFMTEMIIELNNLFQVSDDK